MRVATTVGGLIRVVMDSWSHIDNQREVRRPKRPTPNAANAMDCDSIVKYTPAHVICIPQERHFVARLPNPIMFPHNHRQFSTTQI